jgi:hypothetical protein
MMMNSLENTVVLPEPHELREFFKNNPIPTDQVDRVPYFSDLAVRVIEHSDEVKKFVHDVVSENTPKGTEVDSLSDEDIENLINEVYSEEKE